MSELEDREHPHLAGEREILANGFVRRLDEIAVREGCHLPSTLLISSRGLLPSSPTCSQVHGG